MIVFTNEVMTTFQSGELVCIVVFMNVLTLLVLLLLHYAFTIISRNFTGQVENKQIQKFIQKNPDVTIGTFS